MDTLIALVNRIQRACTVLGDHGADTAALPTLWEALPSVAVVGGQVRSSLSLSLSSSIHSFRFSLSLLLLIYLTFSLNAEFWKVFSAGEHCRPRLSSQGIRFVVLISLTVSSIIYLFTYFDLCCLVV